MDPRLLAKRLIILVGSMADTNLAAERFSLACQLERGRRASLFWDSVWHYPDELARAMCDLADIVGVPSVLVGPIPDRLQAWLAYGSEPDSAVLYVPADLGNAVYDITSSRDGWAVPNHLPTERHRALRRPQPTRSSLAVRPD
jgi:hypothetical protein